MIFDIQKASISKRFFAWLLDVIFLAVLAVGIGAGIGNVLGYDGYVDTVYAAYDKYEEQYGIEFNVTQEEYQAFTQEELERYDAAYQALIHDEKAMKAYNMMTSLMMLIVSLGCLGAYLILEFAVPLWMKNGQTVGKKVFGIALMRVDGVKVTPFMMFVRTLLGKYTVETMVPILIVVMLMFNMISTIGTLIIGLILLAQVILLFANKNHCVIHDLMACTVAVDLTSQMIFESPEAMLEYKKQHHADQVAHQDY